MLIFLFLVQLEHTLNERLLNFANVELQDVKVLKLEVFSMICLLFDGRGAKNPAKELNLRLF